VIEGTSGVIGLSGDFGWNDDEESRPGLLNSIIFIIVACAHWLVLMLLRGLFHLPWIARRAMRSPAAKAK
jgi:hypothetical protein